MTLSAGKTLGQYEIVTLIGAGGMGEVYRARDTRLGRDVALKILPDLFAGDADRLLRFEREARVLASLNHPNIATIHGVEESGPVKALVLELVEGPTLAELVANGPLPLTRSLAIAERVAEALEAAHAAGVVHRDLKPANIKVQNTRVKVLDFGLAKALDSAAPRAALSDSPTITNPLGTRYGLVLGTAAYMAPEQARGEPVDEQADIWAFGCVLFETLTGRPVFDGRSVSDVIAAILRAEPDWSLLPASLHPRVQLLLERCFEKDKANRYHAIADARVDLQRAIAEPNAVAQVSRSLVPYSIAWYWVAVLVAAIAMTAVLTVWTGREPRDVSIRRFNDVLPQDRSFSNAGHPLIAISADASSIAYVANGRLFLRAQERAEPSAIAGTEGSPTTPFFSPDSRFIAYFDFAAGELRRIPIGGGTPVGITRGTNIFGARWDADDTIVYGAETGVWKVPAQGGTPQQLVRIGEGERVYAPQLLPNGESVLFTWRPRTGSVQWRQSQIIVQSLRTGERKVIRNGRDARYLPTGHLVYAADDTLFAVNFDLARLDAVGAPIPVVEGLRFATSFPGMTGTANYDISRDGVLVYVRRGGSSPVPRQLVAVDRSGRAELLVAELRDYWRPRISPDGSRVAVEVDDGPEEAQLWIVDVKQRTAAQLNTGGLNVYCCAWTPDGRFLIYREDRGDQYGLYQQSPDGSDAPRLLYQATEDLMPGDVSRNGVLVFASGEQTGRRSILTMRLGESRAAPFLATPFLEHMPAFSPDGKWIAYASNASGRSEVYIGSYPPSDQPARRISDNGGTAPLWSRDGGELFYRSASGNMMGVPLRTDTAMPAGPAQELFRVQGRFRFSGNTAAYDIEPSGRRLIMVTEPENPRPVRDEYTIVFNWFEELKRLAPAN